MNLLYGVTVVIVKIVISYILLTVDVVYICIVMEYSKWYSMNGRRLYLAVDDDDDNHRRSHKRKLNSFYFNCNLGYPI